MWSCVPYDPSCSLPQKYLLVMQSIFFPTPRIEERFDIKGCLYNRYQNVSISSSLCKCLIDRKHPKGLIFFLFLHENICCGTHLNPLT